MKPWTALGLRSDCSDKADAKAKQKVHARHEIVNGPFKLFGALNQVFQHNVGVHRVDFSLWLFLDSLVSILDKNHFN